MPINDNNPNTNIKFECFVDDQGASKVNFYRAFVFDECGDLVSVEDYDIDGALYTPTGTVRKSESIDENVKISSNDTTSSFLINKIIASDEINTTNALELKEVNDGADEDLKIAFDESKITITKSQISDLTTDTPLPIIVLDSSDNSTSIDISSPEILTWDNEVEKDSGFLHDNSVNNSRIIVSEEGTYKIEANLRVSSASQRSQFVSKILINGVVQPQPYGSAYIRNSGSSSDFWTCVVNSPPFKLNANDYIEVQIQLESQNAAATNTGTFQGSDSSFSIIKLQATKGDKGDTGSGSNIVVQKDNVTIGTLTHTLNFGDGITSVVDEGSNKTTVTSEKIYQEKDSNLNGGTINATFGTPLECVPSSGTLEVVVPKTGIYLISGKINIGTDLNKDNGAIELAYGIDTGSGAIVSAKPWVQTQQAKKNKANGIHGVWGQVSLNQGDVVHLFLSTLSDSTTWTEGEIWIATWS